jgi:hypothetical protein
MFVNFTKKFVNKCKKPREKFVNIDELFGKLTNIDELLGKLTNFWENPRTLGKIDELLAN